MLLKLRMSNVDACVESDEYHQIEAVPGDTVVLPCNITSSSGVMWTQNSTDGYFTYVYVNGSFKDYRNTGSQLSVINVSTEDYSLSIYNVHPNDSGLYDCYETDGRRIVGYYLVVRGWLLFYLFKLFLDSYSE